MDSTKGLDNKAILCRRKIHKVLMVGLLCENMVVGKDRHSFFDAFRVDAFLPLLDECIVARVQAVRQDLHCTEGCVACVKSADVVGVTMSHRIAWICGLQAGRGVGVWTNAKTPC